MADIVVRQPFVRIELDVKRKLRFKHKDLREVVEKTGKPVGELFNDAFAGWPHLLLYGLRWQDLTLSLDKCSEFIDLWAERHIDEQFPLNSMGTLILDALNASGLVRIQAESKLEDSDENTPALLEGNE